MNAFIQTLAAHPLLEVIGWSLVHFVWQAIAIAGAAAIVLLCLPRSASGLRYLVACCGMSLMAIAPLVTGIYVANSTDLQSGKWHGEYSSAAEKGQVLIDFPANQADGLALDSGRSSAPGALTIPAMESQLQASEALSWSASLTHWFPTVVALWIAGVLVLSGRLAFGLWRVGQWKRTAVEVSDRQLLEIRNRLAARMGMKGRFSLLESARLAIPAVIGWLRPALIVPAGFATGMAPAELESLLAHEMAHIRRHDWLVNLIQAFVETVLFYHPAVWWISSVIRREREHCCDDIAIAACGDRIAFAKALARLEESRCESLLAMSASGSSLVARVRRILAVDEKRTSIRWPAGLVSLATMGLLIVGLWATRSIAMETAKGTGSDSEAASSEPAGEPGGSANLNEQDWPVHQPEVERINERTGQTHHVLSGIRLKASGNREVLSDMMYSNVMSYTFIPESVARELGAQELGVIDFGERPVQDAAPRILVGDLVPPPPVPDPADSGKTAPAAETIHVDELAGPAGARTIVPYSDPVIHVPDHLAFYGLNKTGQKKFRVVRIEKVNLGLGPEFGPVNALVLDDANSTIGVLGSNWARIPRGPKGESFVHAAVGGFYFMAFEPPQESTPATGNANPDDRVIATHTYDTSHRESTGWVDMDGVQVPVDAGVEHDGIKVYVSLMSDVVAVDTKTGKTLWSLPWSKTDPIWQTISIIDTKKIVTGLIVEVIGNNGVLLRLDFRSGRGIERTLMPTGSSGQHLNYRSGNAPELDVVQRDGERVVAAMLANPGSQRTAVNLVKRFQHVYQRMPQPGHGQWVTDEESLVSSERPNYVLGDGEAPLGMDAMEVVFNLPEGSNIRAEFSGDNVAMESAGDITKVTLKNGRLKLIDAAGVCRADASADGGADLLVVECKRAGDEYTMRMQTGWSDPATGSGQTPVQVKLNLATGAPADEEQPPHRAVRYRLDYNPAVPNSPMKVKMQWHYDLKRVADEAVQESGQTWEELLRGSDSSDVSPRRLPGLDNPQASNDSIPRQTDPGNSDMEDASSTEAPETSWGSIAEVSGLQSRLTLQTAQPLVGQPLLFRLELRNAGDKPTKYDPQDYAPFRVLRAVGVDGATAHFIGMTPQTSSQPVTLNPGEANVLWENVDASELFLLAEGKYEFFAEGGEWATQTLWRDSNRVQIELQDGRLPPIQAFLKSLMTFEGRPKGWEVSAGHGALYLSHSPTNLKRDVTTIQLWFTDQPLPADFRLGEGPERQEVSTIAPCELGYLHVAGSPKAKELWPEYLRDIRIAAARALNFNASPDTPANEPKPDGEKEGEHDKPWIATGRVTDADGKPLPGVTVRAHTGIGTLRNSGTALTDADGKYVLRFGPGIWSENRKMVQAATISVSLAGHTEKNLHRQGDCVASFEMPDGEIGWGGKTADDLFLPGKPKEIHFVMVPASRLTGIVIGDNGDKLDGVRVSLCGPDMPPSSSVVVNTTTDKGGRFELADIPTGYKWQLLIEPAKAEPPWLAWASPPMTFRPSDDGKTHLDYSVDGKAVDFSAQDFLAVLHGKGINWKSALANSAEKPLELKWDGLSTDDQVSAGVATLELGKQE